ncbi:MAG: sensor histidine kinase [Eubacteriales bacterium]|nr:sensor histidine kinase [Eubacteriales bacterium]
MSENRTERLLLTYLREHKQVFLWSGATLGIFCLLTWLYDMPLTAALYGALLSAVVGAALLMIDFMRWRSHINALRMLMEAPLNEETPFPQPQTETARRYDVLIRRACKENDTLRGKMTENSRNQLGTYSLWTHQMKVPISAMRLLLEQRTDAQSAALLAELFKIEQYTDMALNYARMNASATDYVIRECDLDGILRQLIRKFAPLFIQKKLRICYEPVERKVLTDEKWLLFALEQVLSNAIKYTNTGEIAIKDKDGLLTISDTGIGIAAEDLPRVFEQGFTGYNGRSDKRATGLGLYLCRRTLRKLGHDIQLVSELGKGTTAIIDLNREKVVHE